MKKFVLGFLVIGSIVLFVSATNNTPQQSTDLGAGELSDIPNKDLYNPYASGTPHSVLTDPTILSQMSPEEILRIQQATYDTTVKQRGVLACDVDNDGRDELVVDFGSLGVYLYDPFRAPQWTQLDTRNPEIMIAADHDGDGDFEIFCGWGSGNGADYWTDGSGWSGFNNTAWHDTHYFSADVDGDGDEEIIAKTTRISDGYLGVYIVGADGTWGGWRTLINNITNTYGFSCQFAAPDDELVYGFNGMQWWNHASSDPDFTDNWASMTGSNPDMWDCLSANVDGDTEQEFCADVLSALWIYDYSNATKWVRAVNHSVLDMRKCAFTIGTAEELLVTFSTPAGLWMYWQTNPTTKWHRLNGLTPDYDEGFCEVFNPDGDTDLDVAVDFGAQGIGIWKYDYFGVPKWTPFNGNNPVYMVRADLNGDGDDELLVKFVSPTGLWKWDDDTTPKWIRINGAVPD